MSKYIKFSILTITGIAIGFLGCILILELGQISISPNITIEINPFEIFTLIVTILLAIYVTRTLGKKNDLEKSEKELLIKYFQEFQKSLSVKISRVLEQEEFESIKTNSELKVLRKRLDSILSLAVEHNFIDTNLIENTELRNNLRDIWEQLTDTPKKFNGKASTEVKVGIERLRMEKVSKIETTLIEIERLIFQITIKINKK